MSRTTNFSKKRKGILLVISLIDASIGMFTKHSFFVYLFFSNSNKKAYSFAISFKASKRPEAPP